MVFLLKTLALFMILSAIGAEIPSGKFDKMNITVLNDTPNNRPNATVTLDVSVDKNKAQKIHAFRVITADKRVIPAAANQLSETVYRVDFPAFLAPGQNSFTLEYGSDVVQMGIDGAFCHVFFAPETLWNSVKNSVGKDIIGTAKLTACDASGCNQQIKYLSQTTLQSSSIHRIVSKKGKFSSADFEVRIHTYSATPAIDIELILTNSDKKSPVILNTVGWECILPEKIQTLPQTENHIIRFRNKKLSAFYTESDFLQNCAIKTEGNCLRFTTVAPLTLSAGQTVTLRSRLAFASESEFFSPPAAQIESAE